MSPTSEMNSASDWLYSHWSEEYLPNNKWVAASAQGLVYQNESLDIVISEVENLNSDDIVFAFTTFDIWQ